jgi:hypothetical protein
MPPNLPVGTELEFLKDFGMITGTRNGESTSFSIPPGTIATITARFHHNNGFSDDDGYNVTATVNKDTYTFGVRDEYIDQRNPYAKVSVRKLKAQARDLANGEVAGILRHRDKTKGLVEEGSALDRAMASGILPSQVGQFLTDDENIHKGSEGSVKKSLRNIGDKVRGRRGGRRRKTRRSRK